VLLKVDQRTIYVISVLLGSICVSLEYQSFAIYAANNNIHIVHYNTKVSNPGLQISTDKRSYFKGEIINITIKNGWGHSIRFTNSILGLNIENVNTGQKAGLFGLQVITELKPSESRSIKWDQMDTDARQVQPGIYQAKISSISNDTSKKDQMLAANTTFAIRGHR
jgi:hypothetical protein